MKERWLERINFYGDKRAASEWSVGKLLTIVLAVAVLVLVIYGVSSGALIPLKDKMVGMFQNVRLMFYDDDSSGDSRIFENEYEDVLGKGKATLVYNEEDGWCKIDFEDASQKDYSLNYNEDVYGELEYYSTLSEGWYSVESSVPTEYEMRLWDIRNELVKVHFDLKKEGLVLNTADLSGREYLREKNKKEIRERFSDNLSDYSIEGKSLVFLDNEVTGHLMIGFWDENGVGWGIDPWDRLHRKISKWEELTGEDYRFLNQPEDFWNERIFRREIKQFLREECG